MMNRKSTIFLLLLLFITSVSYGQLGKIADINIYNKKGKIFYKDGSTEEGKLATRARMTLSIKKEGEKWRNVDVTKVDKIEVYRKNSTTRYAFGMSERVAKKKKKRRKPLLILLIYESDNIRLYNEPVTVFGILKSMYFAQRKGEAYATELKNNKKKLLKKYFKDCPELVNKIGTKGFKDTKDIVKYYDTECNE